MKQTDLNNKLLLGVDIGSSKTHALLVDLSGNTLGFWEAGCGNYETVGLEGMIEASKIAVSGALAMASAEKQDILAMGFGIAGYDWPSEKSLMVLAIEALAFDCPFQLVNDAVIGLLAGTSEGWGIAVDAGTGNNIRGCDKSGRIGRITGNSLYFGEFGGAGEMVFQGKIDVTYAWTQRGPKTKITQLFMTYAEVQSEFDLIEGLATGKIKLPAALAKDIIQLAVDGDRVANEVVTSSAHELAKNVNAVIRQLNLQNQSFEIVLFGSVFKAGAIYLKPFGEVIHNFAPEARLIQLRVPPVVGAVLLAAEIHQLTKKAFRETLISSIEEFL